MGRLGSNLFRAWGWVLLRAMKIALLFDVNHEKIRPDEQFGVAGLCHLYLRRIEPLVFWILS